ncbi:hypothetical protein BKA62DRAFT_745487 [Auriculariales sp. MPI-PUGE-AT-0066]|nr:hypothetical protein BKA62DRAFT_745487 [Auriculariales sp. MPI-PUGE-AT-0066]
MFTTKLTTTLLAAVAAANAFIMEIKPFEGEYAATPSSFIPLHSTPDRPNYDFSISFGLSTPGDMQNNNTLGQWLHNVDLSAEGKDSTGPGEFTLQVPLNSTELFNGAGSYILVAAVMRATGTGGSLLFRADQMQMAFNATVSDSEA